MPLEKLRIVNLDEKDPDKQVIEVLYNPQTYVQQRSVSYAQIEMLAGDAPVVQFRNGGAESLRMELFFDSLSAGQEVGGTTESREGFRANQLRTSMENEINVRNYTAMVYDLMRVNADVHRPPKLRVEWASLQFTGFLASCEQTFTKFDEGGRPVRAVLQCEFLEYRDPEMVNKLNPHNSPDTTKFRTVRQGDSLWALADAAYGDAGRWREIAEANGIVNPRRLRTGELLVLPALD